MSILVSVIVPVYNAEKYLAECLDSILGQTFPYFEVIMVNDGSSDASAEICKSYETRDIRFRYVYQQNSGASRARRKGVEEACGEWVTFVDADDLLPSRALEELIAPITSHVNIVTGHISRFSHCLVFEPANKRTRRRIITATEFRKRMVIGLDCGPYAKLIRKTILELSDFDMDPRIIMGEDNIANVRLSFRNKLPVILSNTVVYGYRQHASSSMHTFKESVEYEQLFVKTLYESIPESFRLEFSKAFIQHRMGKMYYHFIRSSDFKKWTDSEYYRNLLLDIKEAGCYGYLIEQLMFSTRYSRLRGFLYLIKRIKDKIFHLL